MGTTEFDLSEARVLKPYEWGRIAAKKFLDELWNHEEHLRTFRSGEKPSRWQAVAALRQRESTTDARIKP